MTDVIRAAFENGRKPFIELDLLGRGGRRCRARCNVDTGGGGRFQISPSVAELLGVTTGEEVRAFVRDVELDLSNLPVSAIDRWRGKKRRSARTSFSATTAGSAVR